MPGRHAKNSKRQRLSDRSSPILWMQRLITISSAVLPVAAIAASGGGENLNIYVNDTVTYDDNLYRLSDDFGPASQIGPGASRDDVINRATLGGDAHMFVGRQTFDLRGQIADNRYRENDNLDYTSGSAAANWNWQLGNRFDGKLGGEFSRTQGDFAYLRTLEKDLIDRQEYYASTRIRVTPRWLLTGEGRTMRIEHSGRTNGTENTEVDTWKAGLMYETPRNDSFGFEYVEAKTRLPDYVVPEGGFDRDSDSKNASLWLKYAYSVKTSVEARVGYQKREYESTEASSFSGTTGRVSLHWEPTVKTLFNLAVWREVQSYAEVSSEYFDTWGVSLDSGWQATDKFSMGLQLSREDRDFPKESTIVPGASTRGGVTTIAGVNARYAPRDYLSMNVSYRQQKRTSAPEFQDYDANIVSAGITLMY